MLNRRMALAMAGLLLMAGAGLRADDKDKVEGDLKALEGVWIQDIGGHEDTWTFKGTNLKLDSPNRKYDMTFKLDEKATPRTVDFKVDKGPEDAEGKSMLGIYKVDGDKLSVCIGIEKRPTEFKQEEGATFLFEMKRKK